MTEIDYLFQELRLIRESYEKAAKPYIDRIVYLKSMEPAPRFIVDPLKLSPEVLEMLGVSSGPASK